MRISKRFDSNNPFLDFSCEPFVFFGDEELFSYEGVNFTITYIYIHIT